MLVYPFSAVLSGLAFFSMGSNYWGRCYAIGLGFFVMAVLMPLHPEWSPLEFGILWTVALTSLGLHLRKLLRESRAEAEQAVEVSRLHAMNSEHAAQAQASVELKNTCLRCVLRSTFAADFGCIPPFSIDNE